MSMNLHCEEVELWQTPTWVTYICYSNGDGGWKGILYRYEQWVKGRLNGVWKKDYEYTDMKQTIDEHLAIINNAVKKHKKLTFGIV